jgi:hypothetical protein
MKTLVKKTKFHRFNSKLVSINDFIQKEEKPQVLDHHFKPKEFNLQYEKKTGNLLSVDKYVELIEKSKGIDMVVMDLQKRTDYTDYMIFVTGSKTNFIFIFLDGHRHMKTIGTKIVGLKFFYFNFSEMV